jgi:methionyl-tRNA formyltransferase
VKLIVFADGAVGLSIVSYLCRNYPNQVACVVTTGKNQIYDFCKENQVQKVVVCESEDEIINWLGKNEINLGILAWWPNIISKRLIESTRSGFLNTHPSLIPWGRGKNYNFWAIVEQSPFGVSIHRVSTEVDAGDVVAQKKIEFDYSMNAEDLYNISQSEMLKLFEAFWPQYLVGKFQPRKINTLEGSFHYAKEMEIKSEILLENTYKAKDLINLLRARTFSGKPSCWFRAEDGEIYEVRVKIKKRNQV